jgi:hypothetical protein
MLELTQFAIAVDTDEYAGPRHGARIKDDWPIFKPGESRARS